LKIIYALMLALFSVAASAQNVDVDKLTLPDGFSVSVYAEIENPRQLAIGANNTVFVGSLRGSVWALINPEEDIRAREAVRVAEGLNTPNGVAYHGGDLFVGEIDRISTIQNIDTKLNGVQSTKTVTDDLPNRRHHGFKFLAIGPDDKIYLPVGAPCNVCEEEEIFGTLLKMNLDGSDLEIIAKGIRNTVGFDFHPSSGELWFTDNGRDMLGDDLPACEINRLSAEGQHFGFPYIHQGDLPDPRFGDGHNPRDYTPPVLKLGAHVAPLGLAFYRGEEFPKRFRNTVFWAEHGSWNRSQKSGYRVMMGKLDDDHERIISNEPFVEGWLEDQNNWGRPVDILNMPDGSILISDDMANAIYRIAYDG
jgi:glucose/arabinose dehydrogenase